MKKILAIIFAAAVLMTFGGCRSEKNEIVVSAGGEQVLSAKEMYRDLDSGKLNIINGETGKTERIFTFMYTKKDVLNFSFEAVTQNGKYYEYYDGKALNVADGTEERAFKWPSAAFKKYKRGDNSTHPNASTGIFFYEPELMRLSGENTAYTEVVSNEDGSTSYIYEYDIDKLSQYMNTVTAEGTMTEYVTEYRFSEDGDFLSLTETSTLDSGKVYTYIMTVTARNEISRIFDLKNTPEQQEIAFEAVSEADGE